MSGRVDRFDLRHLKIASPCAERWGAMSGDDRVRHCQKCSLKMFNIVALPAIEVKALIERTEGRVCVRLYRRPDGTLLTADCPVGLRKARMKLAAALTAVASLVLAAIGTLRTHARDEALHIDDSVTHTAPFWSKVRVRAERLEDHARDLPVVGAIIERLDPTPRRTLGMIYIPPTAPAPRE